MELKNKNYVEYKGKPLVREGDVLYYGFVNDPYILRLDIFMKDAKGNPTMVFVTICPTNDTNKVVKQVGKAGIYEALDVGAEWLEHYNKEPK
ncbi:MAG: hypothetical protein IJD42_04630 [Clostridia bacterium]|nr:hypothetical protein [Clostridia bacterium]